MSNNGRTFVPLECGELGIIDDNRSINDTAFAASTYKTGFEPSKARLNGFRAWCASTIDQNQYLEIDFGKLRLIRWIYTPYFFQFAS